MTAFAATAMAGAMATSVAHAESYVVTPDDCPVSADAYPHYLDDVDAGDLSPWREIGLPPVIFVEPELNTESGDVRLWVPVPLSTDGDLELPLAAALCGQ